MVRVLGLELDLCGEGPRLGLAVWSGKVRVRCILLYIIMWLDVCGEGPRVRHVW